MLNKLLLEEWNYEKNENPPEMYSEHSNKKVWWKCKNCGHEWQTAVTNRSYGTGCPKCAEEKRAKTKATMFVEKSESLLDTCPDIAQQWNYEKNDGILPSDVTKFSNKKVWWKCSFGHEWNTVVVKHFCNTTV